MYIPLRPRVWAGFEYKSHAKRKAVTISSAFDVMSYSDAFVRP